MVVVGGTKVGPSREVVGVSDGPDHADLSTGERVQCGARVDGGVYAAFREWVEEQIGRASCRERV